MLSGAVLCEYKDFYVARVMEVVMTEIPDHVLCTSDHLWIRPGNGSRVRLGVTSVLLDHFGTGGISVSSR